MKYLVFGGDGLQDGRLTFYREKRADGSPGAELRAYAPMTVQQVQGDGTIKQVRTEGTAVPFDKVYEPGEFVLRKMAEVKDIGEGAKSVATHVPAEHTKARAEIFGNAGGPTPRSIVEEE